MLTALKTIFSLSAGSKLSIDYSEYIDSTGEHFFALGPSTSTEHMSFYSKEKHITIGKYIVSGGPLSEDGTGSGYAPQINVWPNLSFEDN